MLANDAVGAAKVTEARRALDFLGKLDPKRYRKMTQDMNNDAVRHKADAYPTTLARAYGIASRYQGIDGGALKEPLQTPSGAALVTEEVHVTLTKDTEKVAGKTGGTKK